MRDTERLCAQEPHRALLLSTGLLWSLNRLGVRADCFPSVQSAIFSSGKIQWCIFYYFYCLMDLICCIFFHLY